ncbi:hypothetical protein H8356DRAFT_1267952 [Neocallimastix lanati (nom. inval.)]|nr:hypothetical protein H8356DRAFT_1267952 [Neocallimastix sp. JGI-2020a]
MDLNSHLAPFSFIKTKNKVTAPSPLQTSFTLFSPDSPLQPKVENFDVKKDDLLVFNTYPYKVSEDLKKIFNNGNKFIKNRGKLSVNNVSIMKEVVEKLNLLNDISKCIVEPDWDIFQKAASIIQANWRGYVKRKEYINNYLEHANEMKNVKFIKNYNYFSKKEPKYITKEELYSKLDFLTRHKKPLVKSNSNKTTSPVSPSSKGASKEISSVIAKTASTTNTDTLIKAATTIQANFRGHYVRHYYNKYQNSNIQATKIQALW